MLLHTLNEYEKSELNGNKFVSSMKSISCYSSVFIMFFSSQRHLNVLTSSLKPFLIGRRLWEAICVKEDHIGATCAVDSVLEQVSLERESRSEQLHLKSRPDLTSTFTCAPLNMNKLLLICLVGAALVALGGEN